MQLQLASEPRPGGENEDFAAVTARAVVVLDGAGMPAGLSTGCAHGVAWFVRHLGAELLAQVVTAEDADLRNCLRRSLARVADRHAGSCDLGNPLQPSSTVALVRLGADRLDWLVLADSTVVIETAQGIQAHTDQRLHATASAERNALRVAPLGSSQHRQALADLVVAERAARNRPGGFWVAAAEARAAEEALTGSVALGQVRRFAVLTDGATRLVDRFGLLDWRGCLDLMDTAGPQGLIAEVRRAEHHDPDGQRWPRSKRHDDATAVFARLTDH